MNRIEPLDISLLNEKAELSLIDHWLGVLNWPNGWHYDLDIIWIIKKLKEAGIKPGSTILDAGAGLGVTQFILSALGYKIISLDFTYRENPRFAKGIFNIKSKQDSFKGNDHEYMEFMTYGQKSGNKASESGHKLKKVLNLLSQPKYFIAVAEANIRSKFNIHYMLEKNKNHSAYGEITFLRGTFNNIPLPDQSVDALISVSAFEHNTYEDMPGSAIEFGRVVKTNGHIFVTTSLAKEKDWYFEAPKGWNLTAESLGKWFDISINQPVEFDQNMQAIQSSTALKKRINDFYKFNQNCGLPYGDLSNAKYIPVGIIKQIKRESGH